MSVISATGKIFGSQAKLASSCRTCVKQCAHRIIVNLSSAGFFPVRLAHSFPHKNYLSYIPLENIDWEDLTHPAHQETIKVNILNRKGVGNIEKVISLKKRFDAGDLQVTEELLHEALQIPNKTSSFTPVGEEENAITLETFRNKEEIVAPQSFGKICQSNNWLRSGPNVSVATGNRTYYFQGDFAKLEEAVTDYVVEKLVGRGFNLLSVPEIVHPYVIEGCGFPTMGERHQVYWLDNTHKEFCLAGTAEMPLASFFQVVQNNHQNFPVKNCAVSRCFRAEANSEDSSEGIYRVHEFNKVEMFGVTFNETGEEGNDLFEEFLSIQKEIFSSFNINFRVLEMPTQELGAPAYRKIDIETWLPHNNRWGELSSTSNCTDYQSRRLNLKYVSADGTARFLTTVNGTACAIPRLMMAIIMNNQTKEGSVEVPKVLQSRLGQTLEPCKPLLNFNFVTKLRSNIPNR